MFPLVSMLLFGCSSLPLGVIPEEQRKFVCIMPFEDQTGEYHKLSKPLENLISGTLGYDYIEIILSRTFSHTPSETPTVKIYPNPFKVVSKENLPKSGFIIGGEVERISYEPILNIKKAIVQYHFWGILGVLFSDNGWRDENMGGYVQYRIHIADSKGSPIDSFATIGASSGDIEKIRRSQMIDNANTKATYLFRIQLLYHLMEKYDWNLPSKIKYVSRKRIEEIENLLP